MVRLIRVIERIHNVLFVVADSELQVTRDNTLLLVIASRIAGKLKNLSRQVFKDGSEVDYQEIQVRRSQKRL